MAPGGTTARAPLDFRVHLLGRVSFGESVDPRRGAKLRARFERIR